MDVSIIIPAYNSEKTIERCLESCICQRDVSVECIVVDDFSTDNTLILLERYRGKGNVKIVVHQENKKQGAARNAAFKNATGEFVFFVDSDDWIDDNACSTLVKLARENEADIAVGSYDIIYPNRTETVHTYQTAVNFLGTMTKEKRERLLMEKGYFCSKLYRRSFLEMVFPNGQLFPEGVYYEDSYFNTITTLRSETIVRTDHICYHYWQNSGSTVHKIDNQ